MMSHCSDVDILVLHPYFKLAYIKMAWRGAEEQEKECQKGNTEVKNWQDKAQKILEETVCAPLSKLCLAESVVLDGKILEGPSNHTFQCTRRPR
jgi:hypothetical protein